MPVFFFAKLDFKTIMDTEKTEVLDVPESQNQKETVMEQKENLEATVEPREPENPPAAVEEADQLAVNGHATEVKTAQETEESVVVENATQEKKEVVVEDKMEKPEEEPVPCAVAPVESAESSEKVSEPVAALDTKPESTEQQPVPENNPGHVQVQLAETTPEKEPEKPAETVPQQKTVPELVVEKPLEVQPPGKEETKPEQVKSENQMPITVEMKTEKEAAAEAVVVAEASPEKFAAAMEGPSSEGGEPAQDQKEVKPENAESVTPIDATVVAEAVKSEQKEPEPQKEEDPVAAPGSLSFPLLEHEGTKDALRIHRTLIVLRGLPGSGKSFLARAIADVYKDQCSVFCADNHGIKPESPSADGYKALDDAVLARCSDGTASSVLIVVDDTNHTHDRLACLGEIAVEHSLVAIFLEPKTEWNRDPSQLQKKSRRGLEEAHLDAMKRPLSETSLPLFFGWFIFSSVQDKLGCTAMDFLKTLDTLEAFKKHIADCECH